MAKKHYMIQVRGSALFDGVIFVEAEDEDDALAATVVSRMEAIKVTSTTPVSWSNTDSPRQTGIIDDDKEVL